MINQEIITYEEPVANVSDKIEIDWNNWKIALFISQPPGEAGKTVK